MMRPLLSATLWLLAILACAHALAQNAPPTIVFSTMTYNPYVGAPGRIEFAATAADSDGSISKVEFFSGATRLATLTLPPYNYIWNNVAPGDYTLTALATDNQGATASSYLTLRMSSILPEVAITGPANGAIVSPSPSITLSANASDADGSIAKVEFFKGSTLLGTATTAPYTYSWTNAPSGRHTITVKATDNTGDTSSAQVSFSVSAAPTVSLAASASGSAPATIVLTATASDPDGSISRVQFFNGDESLGTDFTYPYTNEWSGVGAGTYSLTAKATDDQGAVTASSPVTVIVAPNATPSVTLTAPANGANFATAPATITLSADATDSDSTIDKVQFYNGATLLKSDTTSPYSHTWSSVAAGTYTITAKATDSHGNVTTSSPVTISVGTPNPPPSVSLTTPGSGAIFDAPASILLSASASDANGSITKVEFFNAATRIGTATSAPYTFNWTNVAAGTYTITAKATDNGGATTTSGAANIVVNAAPTVSLSAPANGASYPAVPASISLSANAGDDMGIAKVEFFNGATLIGSVTAAPYNTTWSSVPKGSYTLTAKATDTRGITKTSAPATIRVGPPNVAPTVSVTSPASGATVSSASVTMSANASDSDGTIASVEFRYDGYIMGAVSTPPYTFTWNGLSSGSHTLTAVATDNEGAVTTSAGVSVTVNASPNVGLSTNTSSDIAPANITLNATASDSDGSIAKVEFFSGTTLLATRTAAPYSYTWSNVPAGTYNLTAKATDNLGAAKTSNAIVVTLETLNTPPTISITSPAAGAAYIEPAAITLSASASDPDGSIAKVEFFGASAGRLATLTAPPYIYVWNDAPLGGNAVYAVATDNRGATAESATISLSVNGNNPPTVSLSAPANGGSYAAPASIPMSAAASDSDGSIAKVEFFNGETLLATLTTAPYAYTWSGVFPGTYTLSATATDNRGAAGASSAVSVTVRPPNAAPAVSLSAPADGAAYSAPASITLSATANDSDGIARVEFFNGATRIGTATAAPYNFNWDGVAQGTYSLTAKAFDRVGETASSTSVTVSVGPPFQPPAAAQDTEPAGTLPGAVQVSPLGAATYSIPIQAPPGTAGMTPALSLNYNSQSANGFVGVGWSIGGLSAISRCAQSLAQDGTRGAVNLDANDRYCLDGQRLIAINGTYGADGTEYRTELESYSKIVSYGSAGNGPAWFKVWTKAGQIIEYGNSTDARVEAAGKTTARMWAANKISDLKGNYLTISYTETNGQAYPNRIDYTGNVTTGLASYNSVRFLYDISSRNDKESAYVGGAQITTPRRLTNVQTYAGTSRVLDYRLAYEHGSATSRSRLVSVTQCAGSACLPPTTLQWQDSPIALSAAGAGTPGWTDAGGWNEGLRYFNLDVNGDGKGDIVARDAAGNLYTWLSFGSSFGYAGVTPTGWTDAGGWNSGLRYFSMDVNGDSKVDLVARHGDGTLSVWLSSGTTFTYTGFTATGWSDAAGWNEGLRFFVMDVNADGRSDLVARDGAGNLQSWLSNGSGFTHAGATPTGYSDAAGWNAGLRFFVMDANGDGRADLVARDSTGYLRTWLSNGSTFTAASSTNAGLSDGGQWNSGQRFFVMDVNGDGKADLVTRGTAGHLQVWFSTGTGFASGTAVYVGWGDYGGWNSGLRYFVMDANGDGKGDIVARDMNGQFQLWFSSGTTFVYGGSSQTEYSDDAGWNSGLRYFVMDANGDGKSEIVARAANGSLQTLSFGGAGEAPDLLASVTNGLGATSALTYKPLSDSSVYAKDASAVYPLVDLQMPSHVVAELRRANGIGGDVRTAYSYFGAKADLQGRGFLGFGWTQSQDLQSGITTRVTYRQDYPFIGLPAHISTWGASALAETTSTYASNPLGGTRQFPYLAARTDKRWDLNGAFISWVTTTQQFDAYGNLTQSQTQTKDAGGAADGYVTSTANTFSNDPAKWLLGRLTRSAVTRTQPGAASQTRTQAFAYDSAGLLSQEVIEPDQPNLKLITDYGRDAFGNITSISVKSDPAASAQAGIATRTSTLTYEAKGRFATGATNALGHTETRTFDAATGALLSLTGPNALTTTWTYDGFGRQLNETRPNGTRTTLAYARCPGCWADSAFYVEATNTVVASGETVSPPTRVYYDTLGRALLQRTQGFDGADVYRETQYDERGRVARTSGAFTGGGAMQWTRYSYDELNRVASETAPDGGVTTYAYEGLSASLTNAKGQSSTRVLNSQGQLAQATDAAGGIMRYAYDAFGNPVRTTDPAGNRIEVSYDLRGRRTGLSDPDSGSSSYAYNVLGELVSQTDAKGQTSTMAYDKLSRLTRRSEPDLVSNWYYDTKKGGAACAKGIGKLCEAEADNGYRRVLSYDSLGRPIATTTTIDTAYNAAVGYDAAGRPATLTYPTGFALKYAYNARGYLAEVRNNATNALYWKADAANADGQITAESLGNGLSTTRSFEAASGRLAQVMSAGSTTVHDQRYGYDVLGNLISRSDAVQGVAESFGYDQLNRLVSVSGTNAPAKSVSYDAIGNITSKSDVGAYAYGAKPHAVSGITGTLNGIANPSFSYDANGNLTSGAGRSFTWTSFDLPASITQGATSASFLYGPEHQRVKQSTAGTTTIYLFDPHYEKETTGAGTEHKHYLYAGSQLIGLHTQRANGTNDTRYVHTDHLGSVSVTTNDLGQVVERLAYDAWGKRRNANGAEDPNNTIRPAVDRGYTGHEQLDAGGMGLVHMNGRLYDPQLARVLSPDPIIQAPGFSQSYNRYSYVWNNPLRFFDPGGYLVVDANGGAGVLGTPLPQDELAYYVAPGGTTPRRSVPGMGEAASGSANPGASVAGESVSTGASQTFANNTTFNVSNDSSGFHFSSTTTYTNTSGGNGCTTNCTLVGTPYDGGGGTASGGNSAGVATDNRIVVAAGPAAAVGAGASSSLGAGAALAGKPARLTQQPEDNLLAGGALDSAPRSSGLGGFVGGAWDGFKRAVGGFVEWIGGPGDSAIFNEGGGLDSNVPSNVGPGPNAGEWVPAGPTPRPTKEQQDRINEIGNRDGCHTCGTKEPGTKSGNWIGDHQDPTKLNPEGKLQRYYPQCRDCSNEQGGRVRWLPGP